MYKKPEILKLKKQVSIKPTAPFDFDKTIHKPDHFTSGDNLYEPGIRWQTWQWRGVAVGLKIQNKGTVAKPLVKISVYAPQNLLSSFQELESRFCNSLIEEISYLYNFNLDLKEFY